MRILKRPVFVVFVSVLLMSFLSTDNRLKDIDQSIVSYEVNPEKQVLRMFWKDSEGQVIGSFEKLKTLLNKNSEELIFAMNGGMYKKDQSPLGYYVENGVEKSKVNKTKDAYGNFYLQPNGVFYIQKNNKAGICKTADIDKVENINFATQSGPMLLIDGEYHPEINEGSKNVHIRNGVGINSDGTLIFAISKKKINFYDFATFFKENGCDNALYLDGFVSRAYIPSKEFIQNGKNFGVIIAESMVME